jgi:nitrate/TMAO reductase-like tetraheme cytochrome c subunit
MHGMELGLIKSVIVALSVATIILVVYSVFIRKKNFIEDTNSKWLLFIGFFLLSPLVYFLNYGKALEQSKTVDFCNSCHVMNGYIEDLKNPDSEHIAALHYHYRWISDNQCYQCHSEYGLFGTFKAKMSGIGHIISYYVVGYETPLKLKGTYNNQICLHCHGPVEEYQEVSEHEEYEQDIELNKQSCFGAECHVSPHPEDAWKGINNGE